MYPPNQEPPPAAIGVTFTTSEGVIHILTQKQYMQCISGPLEKLPINKKIISDRTYITPTFRDLGTASGKDRITMFRGNRGSEKDITIRLNGKIIAILRGTTTFETFSQWNIPENFCPTPAREINH